MTDLIIILAAGVAVAFFVRAAWLKTQPVETNSCCIKPRGFHRADRKGKK